MIWRRHLSCHPCPELPSAFAGKAKRESGPKEEKRKRDVPAQPAKAAKPTSGGKSQQPPAPHPPPQVQPAGFSAHKEIKLTLLNKVRPLWKGPESRRRGRRGIPRISSGKETGTEQRPVQEPLWAL